MAFVIPGIVLAAGRSSRMGRPKALLACPGGGTFLSRLVQVLLDGGVAEVGIVLRAGTEHWIEASGLPREPRPVHAVLNPRADEGQLFSVLAGLERFDRPEVEALLVAPVDVPMVSAATVAALLRAMRSGHAPVVRPVFGGRHGHPVVFGRSTFADLRGADSSLGAKAVVRAHMDAVVDVEVDDPGVARDIDTPEEYRALLNGCL